MEIKTLSVEATLLDVKIITLDKPSYISGITYTHDSVASALMKINGPMFGSFYSDSEFRQSHTVDLSKISHEIKDLWIKDNELLANIKILETPCGRDLGSITFSLVNFYLVSIGSIDDKKRTTDDFRILTVDAGVVKTG